MLKNISLQIMKLSLMNKSKIFIPLSALVPEEANRSLEIYSAVNTNNEQCAYQLSLIKRL